MSRTLLSAASVAALLLACSASAAEINRSWDVLAGTAINGKTVVVTLMDDTTVKGKLLGIDAHSITVRQDGRSRSIESSNVFRVRYGDHHVRNGILIGMAVGAAVTVAVDQASRHPSTKIEAAGIGGIVFGLPGGAAAGAMWPKGKPLYEATSRPSSSGLRP